MEIEALALEMVEVSRMGDTSLAKAATSVLAKVAATLPSEGEQHLFHAISQVYRRDVRFAHTSNLDILREVRWKETELTISYGRQGPFGHKASDPSARYHLCGKIADCAGLVQLARNVSDVLH